MQPAIAQKPSRKAAIRAMKIPESVWTDNPICNIFSEPTLITSLLLMKVIVINTQMFIIKK
ncbi:hypothetical protein A4A71_08705 [Nicoletella semolina]|nr:hypothetical protein [Nicoletella semolina]